MVRKGFWRESRDFPAKKWSNHISDSFIEFYGQKYIYTLKKNIWVHRWWILSGKIMRFWTHLQYDALYKNSLFSPIKSTTDGPIFFFQGMYVFLAIEFDKTIRNIIGPLFGGKIATFPPKTFPYHFRPSD